ncbi:MAG: hypothetical protein ACTHJ3_18000 [Pararhizobium sp.]
MADRNIDDALAAFERQLSDLKKQTSRLADSIARHRPDLDDVREMTHDVYRGARRGVRRAARYAKREGGAVADVVRENPGTTTGALAAAGLIGLAVWWYLESGNRRRSW